MAGVEIASLALAVLPIIVSVTEHYTTAARAVKRYRHFSSEIQPLSMAIRVQRTIFHGEIRSLLTAHIGLEEAEVMMQNTNYKGWGNSVLDDSISQWLGTNCGFYLELAKSISVELLQLEARVRAFEDVAESTEGFRPDKNQKRDIKQKCRFLYSKSHLKESQQELKELLEYLRALRRQNEPSQQIPQSSRPLGPSLGQAQQAIEQFALIQTASQNLYDSLKLACTQHTQHQAHFSLKPQYVPEAHQVRFGVGFQQMIALDSCEKQTLWLTVESLVKQNPASSDASKPSVALATIRQSTKRGRDSSMPPPENPKTKRAPVTVQLPSPATSSSLRMLPIRTPVPPNRSSMPNWCSEKDFCENFQDLLSRSSALSECCIGYLEHSSDSKHLLYTKTIEPRYGGPQGTELRTLTELLSLNQDAGEVGEGISQFNRVRLSKNLATAVLQLNPTPWLGRTLDSRKILFKLQSASPSAQIEDLQDPWVDTSVQTTTSMMHWTPEGRPCYPFAPNEFLFGLGVTLLELAFERPLASMQKPSDVEMAGSGDQAHTSFFTAKRLSVIVSSVFGSIYADIVRKCLTCDFGHGCDLSKYNLQAAVYQQVVCELAGLEKTMNSMNLGA